MAILSSHTEGRGTGVLPYGETLHYRSCTCPLGSKKGSRPADVVDVLFQRAYWSFTSNSLVPTRPLCIAYMLPHHNTTGGMKMLVEHVRLLRKRGHTVVAVHRSDSAKRAMPPWTKVEASVDVVCRLHERLNDVYPVHELDVVVIGIFHQVAEMLAGVTAPVLYWEQGHEWLFGDPVRFQVQHNYLKQDQLFHMVMHLPVALAAVSEAVEAILAQEFGRASLIIPNGIDCERFYPGQRERRQPSATLSLGKTGDRDQAERKSVLLVGNPVLPLKGFDVALRVLADVNRLVPIHVTWVCQTAPTVQMLPILASCGLTIDLHISPPQEDIPGLYRGHDAFLFTSRYEAWGMPVLEAMASGLPCVSSRCLGVSSFTQHSVNCLLADPQDVPELARHVLTLLADASLATRLARDARLSALRFTPDAVADRIESVLYSLTACAGELLQARQPCLAQLQAACSWASQACARPASNPAPQQHSNDQHRRTSGPARRSDPAQKHAPVVHPGAHAGMRGHHAEPPASDGGARERGGSAAHSQQQHALQAPAAPEPAGCTSEPGLLLGNGRENGQQQAACSGQQQRSPRFHREASQAQLLQRFVQQQQQQQQLATQQAWSFPGSAALLQQHMQRQEALMALARQSSQQLQWQEQLSLQLHLRAAAEHAAQQQHRAALQQGSVCRQPCGQVVPGQDANQDLLSLLLMKHAAHLPRQHPQPQEELQRRQGHALQQQPRQEAKSGSGLDGS